LKWEKWVYLSAFLCGVVIVNLIGNSEWINNSLLNRYALVSLSFREIVYEEYFFRILSVRIRTVIWLWIGSILLPPKTIVYGFAIIMSAALGSVATMMILANGVWGIWFFICALMPQILFYMGGFLLWKKQSLTYSVGSNRKMRYLEIMFILGLVGIGCICEAFISPVVMENIIKY